MEPDTDKWVEALRGRHKPADARERAMTDAVRTSVEREAEALPQGRDEVGLRRLLRRLEGEGLLRPASARWMYWAVPALAASVLAVVVLNVYRPQAPQPAPVEIQRGVTGAVVVKSPAPEQASAAAFEELWAMRLKPFRIPMEDRVVIQVEVSDEMAEPFAAWFEARGGTFAGAGVYRVVFKAPD